MLGVSYINRVRFAQSWAKNSAQLIGNLLIIITYHMRVRPKRQSRICVPKTILPHTHRNPHPTLFDEKSPHLSV
jgi:hypothetical protein